MNIIQNIIDKNVKIDEKDFTERITLKELALNQRDKLEKLTKELDIQKELFQQYQKKYTVYSHNLENQFFNIILKEFKNLYSGTYFKEISYQNQYNYFFQIKEIANNYFSQNCVTLKVTALRVRSDSLRFENIEHRFFSVEDLKKFFENYIALQEPELTKIATYMLLSSNLISECK